MGSAVLLGVLDLIRLSMLQNPLLCPSALHIWMVSTTPSYCSLRIK